MVENLIPETPRMKIIDCTIAIILSCALKKTFKKTLRKWVTVMLMTEFCRWLYDGESCHQHKRSPKSVTTIDMSTVTYEAFAAASAAAFAAAISF